MYKRQGQARPLLALRSAAQQIEAAERIKEGELSARQAEALVKSMQNKSSKAKTGKPQNLSLIHICSLEILRRHQP